MQYIWAQSEVVSVGGLPICGHIILGRHVARAPLQAIWLGLAYQSRPNDSGVLQPRRGVS
jgi:hypothetical protein